MRNIVNVVIISDTSNGIVQMVLDSLWYSWEDAAERVKELNSLYVNVKEHSLHAHYYQEVVK